MLNNNLVKLTNSSSDISNDFDKITNLFLSESRFTLDKPITSGSFLQANAFYFDFLEDEITKFSELTSNVKLESFLPKIDDLEIEKNISSIVSDFVTASSQIGPTSFIETRIVDSRAIREKARLAIQKLEDNRKKLLANENDDEE